MGITAWNRKDKKNTLVYQTKRHTIILPPSALHLPTASAARDGGIRRGCASSPAHREPGEAGGAGSRRAALAAGAGQAERVPGCAGRCRGPDPLPREKGSVRGAFLLRVPAAMRWLFVPPQRQGRQQLTLVYEIIWQDRSNLFKALLNTTMLPVKSTLPEIKVPDTIGYNMKRPRILKNISVFYLSSLHLNSILWNSCSQKKSLHRLMMQIMWDCTGHLIKFIKSWMINKNRRDFILSINPLQSLHL